MGHCVSSAPLTAAAALVHVAPTAPCNVVRCCSAAPCKPADAARCIERAADACCRSAASGAASLRSSSSSHCVAAANAACIAAAKQQTAGEIACSSAAAQTRGSTATVPSVWLSADSACPRQCGDQRPLQPASCSTAAHADEFASALAHAFTAGLRVGRQWPSFSCWGSCIWMADGRSSVTGTAAIPNSARGEAS